MAEVWGGEREWGWVSSGMNGQLVEGLAEWDVCPSVLV